ncbi:MAG: hypothetical protein IPL28_18220 [Chloroflexi bacterium]|nr:hypothetical protein [Chloroflexota bacterium]
MLLLNLGVVSNTLQFFNSYYTTTALAEWYALDRRLTVLLMIFSLALFANVPAPLPATKPSCLLFAIRGEPWHGLPF